MHPFIGCWGGGGGVICLTSHFLFPGLGPWGMAHYTKSTTEPMPPVPNITAMAILGGPVELRAYESFCLPPSAPTVPAPMSPPYKHRAGQILGEHAGGVTPSPLR